MGKIGEFIGAYVGGIAAVIIDGMVDNTTGLPRLLLFGAIAAAAVVSGMLIGKRIGK